MDWKDGGGGGGGDRGVCKAASGVQRVSVVAVEVVVVVLCTQDSVGKRTRGKQNVPREAFPNAVSYNAVLM